MTREHITATSASITRANQLTFCRRDSRRLRSIDGLQLFLADDPLGERLRFPESLLVIRFAAHDLAPARDAPSDVHEGKYQGRDKRRCYGDIYPVPAVYLPAVQQFGRCEGSRDNEPVPGNRDSAVHEVVGEDRDPEKPVRDHDEIQRLQSPVSPRQPVKAEADQVSCRPGLPFDPLIPERAQRLHAPGIAPDTRGHLRLPASLAEPVREIEVFYDAVIGPGPGLLIRPEGNLTENLVAVDR